MPNVSFKGTREGLCITLGEGAWRELMTELAIQLDRPGAQSFFRGARVLLETGSRAIGVVDLEELINLLSRHEMTLSSVSGESQSQAAFDQLRTALPPPEVMVPSNGNSAPPDEEPMMVATDDTRTLLVRRTVRSGQVIHYPGPVLIFGDVNPGAEVVADGDVFVWGKLRGVVHAGAAGDEKAIVSALNLAPTQLRIGNKIARAPDGRRPRNAPAEMAHVRNGQIVVEPWGA